MQTTADQLVTNCNISVTKMCEQKMNIRHFPLFSAFFSETSNVLPFFMNDSRKKERTEWESFVPIRLQIVIFIVCLFNNQAFAVHLFRFFES